MPSTPPTGQDLYDFVTKTLLGFAIDQTYFIQLLNVARGNREGYRPWKVLQTVDTSQTCSPSDTFTTPKTLPANFRRLTKTGCIKVFDGQNKYVEYTEVPQEQAIEYKDVTSTFFIDHFNMQYFLCGKPDQNYTIYFYYCADPGDISLTTSWLKFPSRYHYLLAYDVANLYRLGADYDDISARMGTENGQQAETIFKAMVEWDNELALSSVTEMDYPSLSDANPFISGHINRF